MVYCLIAVGAVGFGACFDFVLRIVLMYCLLVWVLCYWFVCVTLLLGGCSFILWLCCGSILFEFLVLGCGCSFGWL